MKQCLLTLMVVRVTL